MYIEEREGKGIVERLEGFATYSFLKDGIYLEDIFVHPLHRRKAIASELADTVARIGKNRKLKYIFGSVSSLANNSTASLKALLAYGFEIDNVSQNFIFMKKEL